MKTIMIIDYGMGNLDSVKRAVEECGFNAFLTSVPNDLKNASNIILPGVGAFPKGMQNLIKFGFVEAIKEQVMDNKIPLLGICLGMQLLADFGNEFYRTPGLALIKGEVIKFVKVNEERIPHVGWNEITVKKKHNLVNNIVSGTDFYFVHSFHFKCENDENIVATTNYCYEFPSIIADDNILGTQFHPEKSQKMGFRILKNFLEM